jgi:NitT/TauT family transport system ATP-binding protein
LLAGLEAPTKGTADLTARKGETSVVFQSPTLAPWLTAQANVALPLDLSGVHRAEARLRAQAALTRVGLGDALAARPAQLSGGMAMRAALARALVTKPRLLLLDEPFAALDEITRRRLADDLLSIWAETGAAMVFVTHNVEEAVYVAGRVVVMTPGPGRLAGQVGIDAPAPRAAGFRLTPEFRAAVEATSEHLFRAMAA